MVEADRIFHAYGDEVPPRREFINNAIYANIDV